LHKTPPAKKKLDLGTGVGTVGLAVLWGLGEGATLTCVEAQEVSYRLLTENILGNGLSGSVRAIDLDIRDLSLGERSADHRESALLSDRYWIAAGGFTKGPRKI